jgi:signal-transduction protein with cAMP-binding, CBS, and nucleotidyltransferase domain
MPAKIHLSGVPSVAEKAPAPSIETAIAQHPFLVGLSPHHLRLLSNCAVLASFTTGELIFKEGHPANCSYLIQKGKVALECRGKDGDTLIQIIGSGDVLGWSWLFPPYWAASMYTVADLREGI